MYRLIVGNDPRQLSFGLALWTREVIQELIVRQFGIQLSRVSVGNILTRMGMSPGRPLRRAYERDPEKAEKWKAETFPEIQACAKKEGALIFFADESSVQTDCHVGTTWAPTGQIPVVKGAGGKRSATMVSAISARGRLHFTIREDGIDGEAFLAFAKDLIKDEERLVFLVIDNRTIHHAEVLKEYAEQSTGMLRLYFLPPYSPDLNPGEWTRKNAKHSSLEHATAKSEGEPMQFTHAAFSPLNKASEEICLFFAGTVEKYDRLL